jgi:hypothetical protein
MRGKYNMAHVTMYLLIAAVGAFAVWCVLYGLFIAKTEQTKVIFITLVATIAFVYFILPSYDLYAQLGKSWFQRSESGEIQLAASPLKVKGKSPDEYCKQFTQQDGSSLGIYSYGKHGVYCGYYPGIENSDDISIPYKLLQNGKARYWSYPELQIIGPAP